jgi:menaquinone-dependent protoporphyrinogen IX oxidase
MRFIDKYPELLKNQSLASLLVKLTYTTMDLENQRVETSVLQKIVKETLEKSVLKAF